MPLESLTLAEAYPTEFWGWNKVKNRAGEENILVSEDDRKLEVSSCEAF